MPEGIVVRVENFRLTLEGSDLLGALAHQHSGPDREAHLLASASSLLAIAALEDALAIDMTSDGRVKCLQDSTPVNQTPGFKVRGLPLAAQIEQWPACKSEGLLLYRSASELALDLDYLVRARNRLLHGSSLFLSRSNPRVIDDGQATQSPGVTMLKLPPMQQLPSAPTMSTANSKAFEGLFADSNYVRVGTKAMLAIRPEELRGEPNSMTWTDIDSERADNLRTAVHVYISEVIDPFPSQMRPGRLLEASRA